MAVRRILLDTNAYAAFKRNRVDAVEVIQSVPFIGVSSIVLGELFAGFAVGNREEKNHQELQQFLNSQRVALLPVDAETSNYYAQIYRSLRVKGQPIPTNDMWIAATALQHDLMIFSYDQHFQAVDPAIVGRQLTDFVS